VTPSVLIFDGECDFCRRWIGVLRRWDTHGRLSFVPFQDSRALEPLPAIPRSELEQAMHLVTPERQVLKGAAALPVILRLVPFGWLLAPLYRLPGAPWLADRVYRMVARNRHRWVACG
jgi:predicted DCC family thiol-disulfide oxidoreductase YuxK